MKLSADIVQIIKIVFILVIAFIQGKRGLYNCVTKVFVYIMALIVGITGAPMVMALMPGLGLIGTILAFVLITALAKFILDLIRKLIGKIADLPVIGWLNHLLGFGLGYVEGALLWKLIENLISYTKTI